MSFDLQKVLNWAEKEMLLNGKDEFIYEFRFSSEIKSSFTDFEEKIRSHDDLEIVGWRNIRTSGLSMGLPSQVSFDSSFLLKHRPFLKKIRSNFNNAISRSMVLNVPDYIKKNYSLCKRYHHELPAAVAIADYIIANRENIKGLYPRQIAHGQSTKLLLDSPLIKGLLAQHFMQLLRDEQDVFRFLEIRQKPSSFQFFANSVSIRGNLAADFYGAINDYNLQDFKFESRRTIIVENEEAYLPLTEKIDDAVVVFGGGWKAMALARFSHMFSGKVYYWGDCDAEGLEILNGLVDFMPEVIPIAMDESVVSRFASIAQKNKTKKPQENVKMLVGTYEKVCLEGIRIEQEQLPIDFIIEQIT